MKITSVTVSTVTTESETKIMSKVAMGHNHKDVQKYLDGLSKNKYVERYLTDEGFYVHQIITLEHAGGFMSEPKMIAITVYHKINQ